MTKVIFATLIVLAFALFLITCENNTTPIEVSQDQELPNIESPHDTPPPPPPATCGRMTGGGSVFRLDGVRVTRGFELHCDLSLPNNLEVNWLGGKKFHLTALTSVECTDDVNIIQEPPAAPFDTFDAWGVGTFNKESGAVIHFIFVDAGEPGVNDTGLIEIWDPDGNLVLEVSGNLNKGNFQAHVDNDCE